MWAYDLHLYTVAYLSRDARPRARSRCAASVLAALVPLFALGAAQRDWRIQRLARRDLPVALAGRHPRLSDRDDAGGAGDRRSSAATGRGSAQVAFIFVMTLAALVLLPSARLRGLAAGDARQASVRASLRLSRRNGCASPTRSAAPGEAGAPLERAHRQGAGRHRRRARRACCCVADDGRPAVGRRRAGTGAAAPLPRRRRRGGAAASMSRAAASSSTSTRSARPASRSARRESRCPPGSPRSSEAWAGVPLLHDGRLAGLVILAHPPSAARSTGRISTCSAPPAARRPAISPRRASQEALADAQRFDEFNRRFAFIMHDIKNLASQLTLVARNAERHADNPEFRADMIATLQSSVDEDERPARPPVAAARARERASRRGRSGRAAAGRASPAPTRRAHPVTVVGEAAARSRWPIPPRSSRRSSTSSRTRSTPAPRRAGRSLRASRAAATSRSR